MSKNTVTFSYATLWAHLHKGTELPEGIHSVYQGQKNRLGEEIFFSIGKDQYKMLWLKGKATIYRKSTKTVDIWIDAKNQ